MRRVLVVDDSDLWRRSVRSILQTQPLWTIVAEAADGWEALQEIETHEPDLILLDVTLPRLNGIETARRILEREAAPKILFMSAQSSWDIAEAALATGAHGFLFKGDAGSDLLRAMKIVAEGGRFVSPQISARRVRSEGVPD